MNKANIRDLIAATGLVISFKLDSSSWFFIPDNIEIRWMTSKTIVCTSARLHQALCNISNSSLNLNWSYSIHVPGWLQKWLNLITAPGSVSNEPGSVTWLATKYLKTVSWRNHTEKLTTWWPQNISFWPKINIPSSYFTILMQNCLENTLKLQFDSYVTAVKFLT